MRPWGVLAARGRVGALPGPKAEETFVRPQVLRRTEMQRLAILLPALLLLVSPALSLC